MNRGFTLIELLVVFCFVFILIVLMSGFISFFFATVVSFDAKVIDKWTDMNADGSIVYRCRTMSSDGEVNTWDSCWVHNKIMNGEQYKFTVKMTYLLSAKVIQPIETSNNVEVVN